MTAIDLVTWLRQQLDEDEVTTRELLYWAQQTILTLQDPKLLGKYIPGWHDWPKVERMCRVRLAELDAKRRILDLHARDHECSVIERGTVNGEPYEDVNNCAWMLDTDHCSTVRLLALPYAGCPGYRQEWAP